MQSLRETMGKAPRRRDGRARVRATVALLGAGATVAGGWILLGPGRVDPAAGLHREPAAASTTRGAPPPDRAADPAQPERSAGSDGTLLVRVVGPSGAPLPSARARILGGDSSSAPEVTCAADGTLLLEAPSRVALRVRATGHVGRDLVVDPRAAGGEVTVALPLRGGVEVLFRGRSGLPIPEQRAVLLPPALAGRARAGWLALAEGAARAQAPWEALERADADSDRARARALIERVELDGTGTSLRPEGPWVGTSDERGSVAWEDVPAASGYRWGCVGRLAAAVVPRHEQYVPEGGEVGDRPEVDEPAGLSGSFEVAAGGRARYVVEGSALCGLTAFLPGYDRAIHADASLQVFREAPMRMRDGSAGWATLSLGCFPPDDNGVFLIEGLRAGTKTYTARWREGDHYGFARGGVHLSPGEVRDLGPLRAVEGFTAEARVVFRRADQETAAVLEPLHPERHLAEVVLMPGAEIPYERAVRDTLHVVPGRPFRVSGLPPGEYGVRVATPPGFATWPSFADPDLEVTKTFHSFHFRVPDELEWELEIPVLSLVPVTFLFDCSDWARPEAGPVLGRGYLRGSAGWTTLDVGSYPIRDPLRLSLRKGVPPGRHELLLWAVQDGAETGGYARGQVEIGRDGSLAPVLRPRLAAAIRGRLVDPSGAPRPRDHVAATPADLFDPHAEGRYRWLYYEWTDAGGHFLLRGLPPNTALRVERVPGEVATPGEGVVLDLGDVAW